MTESRIVVAQAGGGGGMTFRETLWNFWGVIIFSCLDIKDSYLILCVYQYSQYYRLKRVNFAMCQLYLNKLDLTKNLWSPLLFLNEIYLIIIVYKALLEIKPVCFSTLSPTPSFQTPSDPLGQDFLLVWGNVKLVPFSRHCTCSFSSQGCLSQIIPC